MKSFCIIAYTNYLTDARVMRLAEAACQADYAVDVITPINRGEKSKTIINQVRVYRLRVKNYIGPDSTRYILSYMRFFISCFFKVSWLYIKNGYQSIQVCNMPDFLVFSTIIAKLSGAKVILDIHDPIAETYLAKFSVSRRKLFYRLLIMQETLSAAYSDHVLTVNEPVKRDILIKDGIRENKITVIANFADDRIFNTCDRYQVSLPIRMIYHGTIAARFGFEDVLSAVADVLYKDKLKLKIIGKGDYEIPLQKKIRALGLESLVEFDNKLYPLRDLPAIICEYQLGLVPYALSPATNYMLPVKLMELLAMGIPSITITNTAIRHYIDERLYFSYDPQHISSLAQLIDRIIENPSLILEKREAILGEQSKFKWKDEQHKYLSVLSNLSQ